MPRKTLKLSYQRGSMDAPMMLTNGAIYAEEIQEGRVCVVSQPHASFLMFNGLVQNFFHPGDKLIIEFGEIPDAEA